MDRELLLWCCILLSESGYKTVYAKEPCSQICLQTLFYVCCPLGRICFSVVYFTQVKCPATEKWWLKNWRRVTSHKEIFIVIRAVSVVRFNGLIFKMLLMLLFILTFHFVSCNWCFYFFCFISWLKQSRAATLICTCNNTAELLIMMKDPPYW